MMWDDEEDSAAEDARRARDVRTQLDPVQAEASDVPRCRVCGCHDLDCRRCIERTGEPCEWVPELENDDGPICSACVEGEAIP